MIKMTITLYNNSSELNVVSKVLAELTTTTAVLKDDTEISAPVVQLKSAMPPTANYCYIPAFKRYYYISRQNIRPGGINELSLQCDVLMSYRDTILNSTVIAERSTNRCNKNLPDNIPLLARRNVLYKKLNGGIGDGNFFGSDKPGASNYSLLLTVINTRGVTPVGAPTISFIDTELTSEVKITWNNLPDVTDYRVYRKGGLDSDFVLLSRVTATTETSYIFNDVLTLPGTYYYRVQAECNQALGGYSNTLSRTYEG